LLFNPGVMVISVPYLLSSSQIGERRAELMDEVPAGRGYLGYSENVRQELE
jgi:hypothetical protein